MGAATWEGGYVRTPRVFTTHGVGTPTPIEANRMPGKGVGGAGAWASQPFVEGLLASRSREPGLGGRAQETLRSSTLTASQGVRK